MKSTRKVKDYDLLSGYSFFIPGPSGIFVLTLLFLVGALIGNVIAAIFMLAMGGAGQDYMILVSYPVMFIPPMMYALGKSRGNALFDKGCRIDSRHFGGLGAGVCCVLVVLATLCTAFIMDIFNSMMPEMPEWLENTLKSMTQGKFWVNFLCVSVFAPFFEEWLCRGMVLRGLLNYKRANSEDNREYGIKPVWAIIISALFFAVIHLNPWQALPAFALGCLFGYVYYKTGSLWLTMLMHFTNNTFALILGNIDSLKDYDNFIDALSVPVYSGAALVCAAVLFFALRKISSIRSESASGNCDIIE
ncbi:MAG: lysostaphin resistance A-like protein [Candidatus Cryptobacteroides sp.]